MNKAKAAIFTGVNKLFDINEYELTQPQEGYALLELIASGVCGTDIHIHTGKLGSNPPQIIGHEFVGKVTEISDEDSDTFNIKCGDYVISTIAVPCCECLLCKNGDDANCVSMQVTNGSNPNIEPHLHGGYGEYNYSPVKNLVRIPDGVNPKAAAVFACPGPTVCHSIALAKRANIDLATSKYAIVQGAGPVGYFAAIYFASIGIENVIMLNLTHDRNKEELAKKFGVTEFIGLDSDEFKTLMPRLNDGLGADIVFEASGNPKAIPVGMDLLRNRGVYLVPGQYSNSGGIEIQPQLITFKALQIIGSSQYSVSDIQAYVEFLNDNSQLYDIILSLATCYKVEDVNQAFDDMKKHKNIKTLLVK